MDARSVRFRTGCRIVALPLNVVSIPPVREGRIGLLGVIRGCAAESLRNRSQRSELHWNAMRGFANLTGYSDPLDPPRPLVGWRLKRSDFHNVLLATGLVTSLYVAAALYGFFTR